MTPRRSQKSPEKQARHPAGSTSAGTHAGAAGEQAGAQLTGWQPAGLQPAAAAAWVVAAAVLVEILWIGFLVWRALAVQTS